MKISGYRMHKDERNARGMLYVLLQVGFIFYRFSRTLARLFFICL